MQIHTQRLAKENKYVDKVLDEQVYYFISPSLGNQMSLTSVLSCHTLFSNLRNRISNKHLHLGQCDTNSGTDKRKGDIPTGKG